jgi:hypothetical protein
VDSNLALDVIIFLVLFVLLFVIVMLVFTGLKYINFWQLESLHQRTCEIASIPKQDCFCEMDFWGNVMCSQKSQQSYSVTIITEGG